MGLGEEEGRGTGVQLCQGGGTYNEEGAEEDEAEEEEDCGMKVCARRRRARR